MLFAEKDKVANFQVKGTGYCITFKSHSIYFQISISPLRNGFKWENIYQDIHQHNVFHIIDACNFLFIKTRFQLRA